MALISQILVVIKALFGMFSTKFRRTVALSCNCTICKLLMIREDFLRFYNNDLSYDDAVNIISLVANYSTPVTRTRHTVFFQLM